MRDKNAVWLETICAKAVDGSCKGIIYGQSVGPKNSSLFDSICSRSPEAYMACSQEVDSKLKPFSKN